MQRTVGIYLYYLNIVLILVQYTLFGCMRANEKTAKTIVFLSHLVEEGNRLRPYTDSVFAGLGSCRKSIGLNSPENRSSLVFDHIHVCTFLLRSIEAYGPRAKG